MDANPHSLTALAHPTRRRVFEALRAGPRAVGELAAELPVTRPAVSQHLKVLKGAGLVSDTPDGTRRLYAIDHRGLSELRSYVESFWEEALDGFRAHAESATSPPRNNVTRRNRKGARR